MKKKHRKTLLKALKSSNTLDEIPFGGNGFGDAMNAHYARYERPELVEANRARMNTQRAKNGLHPI